MIAYIKKHWQMIVILLLILFIAVSGIVSNCTGDKIADSFTQAYVDSKLNVQRQSLESKFYTELGDTLKKLQLAEKERGDKIKPVIIYKKIIAEKYVEQVRKDTATTAMCDSAINAQEEVIFDIDMKAYSDSLQLDICNRRLIVSDSANKSLNRAFSEEVRINSELQKTLIKSEKGKNTKWWFLGIGAVLGILISK